MARLMQKFVYSARFRDVTMMSSLGHWFPLESEKDAAASVSNPSQILAACVICCFLRVNFSPNNRFPGRPWIINCPGLFFDYIGI